MSRLSSDKRRGLAGTLAYAVAGLRHAVQTQRTFRIHLAIAAMVAILIFVLDLDSAGAALVVLAMALVIAAELFNTGIEAVVDLLVEQNRHSIAKVAKDISAGSVLTTTIAAAIVGSLVLGPPVVRALGFPSGLAALPRWVAAGLLVAGGLGFVRLLRRPGRGSELRAEGGSKPLTANGERRTEQQRPADIH